MSLSNQIDIDNLNVDDIMKIIDYYNNKSNEIINVKVKRKKMSDEERKERNRERALQRYYDTRDTILTNKKNKYHNDMAYQQKVKNASKNNYLKDLETNWLAEIEQTILEQFTSKYQSFPVILIGNKIDLKASHNSVTQNEVNNLKNLIKTKIDSQLKNILNL